MKKSRFTNEQIAFGLRQVESGTPIEEVCRKLGICRVVVQQSSTTQLSGQPGPQRICTVQPGNSGQITTLDFLTKDGSENGGRSQLQGCTPRPSAIEELPGS